MKPETEVVVAATLVLLGVFLGKYIESGVVVSTSDVILPAISTLAAAFLGAKYAFDLQNNKNSRDAEDKKVGAINAAIFALARKQSKLENIRTQFFEPWKTDPAAFLNLPPLQDLEKDDIRVDIEALGFLFETAHVNLAGELTIAVAKYRSIIDAVNERSRLHRGEVQPVLETAGILARTHYKFQDIETALGPRLYATLRQATDQVIEGLPASLAYIETVSAELTKVGKLLFPNRRIMKVALLATAEKI